MIAFRPSPTGTVQISASTSSSNVKLAGSVEQVYVQNSGSADAFVEFGDSSVTATVPSGATAGSMRVKAGQTTVLTPKVNATHAAAITSSGTTTIELSSGAGL